MHMVKYKGRRKAKADWNGEECIGFRVDEHDLKIPKTGDS